MKEINLDSIEKSEVTNEQLVTTVEKVVKKLITNHITITAAESLTAGMFQEKIADVSGASAIFSGGFVTYSAEAKQELIGVSKSTIQEYGVVSSQVAKEMAAKSKSKMQSLLGVGLTGVAGPGTLEGHPAGTVHIAVDYLNEIIEQKFNFTGNRQEVRLKAVFAAFLMIEKQI